MSDSLKPDEFTKTQYGAISMEDMDQIIAKDDNDRCCSYSKPMRLLVFAVFSIAFIICITLRFGVYTNSDTNHVRNKGSSKGPLLPFCEKGPLGCAWNDNLLIFGGKAKGNGNFLNYILYFDTTELKWKKIFGNGPKGVHPTTLWKSDGVVTNNALYVYGGSTSYHKSTEQRTMWKYDLQIGQWNELTIKNTQNHPYVRAHCMVMWGDRQIILFGGKNHTGYDQNWVLKYDITQPSKGFVRYSVEGRVPEPRQAPGCGVMEDKFIIFGGRNVGGFNKLTIQKTGEAFKYYNDLWTFNLNTAVWEEVSANGNRGVSGPEKAAHLSLAVYRETAIITGGHNSKDVLAQNWMFDFSELKWKKLMDLPPGAARCSHVGAYVKWGGVDEGVLVFGGQFNMPDQVVDVGSVLRNDLLWYDIGKNVWEVIENDNCPAAKAYWRNAKLAVEY